MIDQVSGQLPSSLDWACPISPSLVAEKSATLATHVIICGNNAGASSYVPHELSPVISSHSVTRVFWAVSLRWIPA